MKVPRLRGGEDPAAIVGFEVEQMIMPTLPGRTCRSSSRSGDFTRLPYIVMERIEGSRCASASTPRRCRSTRSRELGAKVATALHDLHRQRVVHLDVKPSNIMLRRAPTAAKATRC